MVASRTFNNILPRIQSSNLNFQLQISPFSANIYLKKTLIRDQYGAPLPPPQPSPMPLCPCTNSTPARCSASDADLAARATKNLQLENDLVTMRKDHENFHSRRWGSSLPGLGTRDPPHVSAESPSNISPNPS